MTSQYSVDYRNAAAALLESTIGSGAIMVVCNGTKPLNCAAAETGTRLGLGTLPPDFLGTPSNGQVGLVGTWTITGLAAAGSGTIGTYSRIYNSTQTVCHWQGDFGTQVQIPTASSTPSSGAGSNVLSFTSGQTTGVVVGMRATGTGIQEDTYVAAVTSTTVTLSRITNGVASGASIAFQPDATANNASLATGQASTVTAFVHAVGGA